MDRRILRRRITTLQIIELLSGPCFTETRALSTNTQSSFVKVEELDQIIQKKNRIDLESSHPEIDRIWTFQRYSHF